MVGFIASRFGPYWPKLDYGGIVGRKRFFLARSRIFRCRISYQAAIAYLVAGCRRAVLFGVDLGSGQFVLKLERISNVAKVHQFSLSENGTLI